MRKTVFLSLTLLLALPGNRGAAFAEDRTSPELLDLHRKMDAAVEAQLDDELGAGLLIGIQIHGRKEFWSYGHTRLPSGPAPDADTEFEIGSITKTFTSLLLAKLSLAGTVALDDRLEKYLPELAGTSVGAVTLRQLATHTSGLPRLPGDLVTPPYDPADPYRWYDESRAFAYLRGLRVHPIATFNPANYSNLGVGLLGLALSRAGGQKYAVLLQREILEPLGLTDTAVDLSPSQRNRLAQGHNDLLASVPEWHFTSVTNAAGSLHSTGVDLMKYLDASLHPEYSPLEKALQLTHAQEFPGTPFAIGLAWILQGTGAMREIWHDGETAGYNSWLGFRSNADTGLLVLNNTGVALQCVHELIFGDPCTVHTDYPLTEAERDQVVGVYQFAQPATLEIYRNGVKLVALYRQLGQAEQRFRLVAYSPTVFTDTSGEVALQFLATSGGSIDSVQVKAPGQNYIGKKGFLRPYGIMSR